MKLLFNSNLQLSMAAGTAIELKFRSVAY